MSSFVPELQTSKWDFVDMKLGFLTFNIQEFENRTFSMDRTELIKKLGNLRGLTPPPTIKKKNVGRGSVRQLDLRWTMERRQFFDLRGVDLT